MNGYFERVIGEMHGQMVGGLAFQWDRNYKFELNKGFKLNL